MCGNLRCLHIAINNKWGGGGGGDGGGGGELY